MENTILFNTAISRVHRNILVAKRLEGFQNGSYLYNCHSAVVTAQLQDKRVLSVDKSLHYQ